VTRITYGLGLGLGLDSVGMIVGCALGSVALLLVGMYMYKYHPELWNSYLFSCICKKNIGNYSPSHDSNMVKGAHNSLSSEKDAIMGSNMESGDGVYGNANNGPDVLDSSYIGRAIISKPRV